MLLSQTVTSFIQFNKKNTYIFQKTTIFIILLPKLKMHISLLYSWSIQTIRSWFLILVIKHNLPYGYTSISFQIREWIHQGETSFLMVTITFTSSTQNRRKKYGISTQSSKPLCVCVKTNTSFQLQLEISATFHVQKIFSIFLWISKKLGLSDNQHKTSVSLGWQILAKKCNIFKTTFKRWMYANLAFHIKFNIFSYIYKPIQMQLTGWQVHELMLI